jgi:hypothetical protein
MRPTGEHSVRTALLYLLAFLLFAALALRAFDDPEPAGPSPAPTHRVG